VADEIASALGLVIWDLEFTRQGGRETLRVAVDRVGGIDAEGITRFAESLSRELDARNAIPGDDRYLLEVTSPGAERRLRTPEQFAVCIGRPVRITFKDGREPMAGELTGASDDGVTVGGTHVSYEEMSQARLNVAGV
jgi:ribosome maturation factor RimP